MKMTSVRKHAVPIILAGLAIVAISFGIRHNPGSTLSILPDKQDSEPEMIGIG